MSLSPEQITGNKSSGASDITDPHPTHTHTHGYLLKGEEEPTRHQNEDEGEVEHPRLLGHHNPPIAVELVPTREGLPLPPLRGPVLVRGLHRRGAASADLTVLALSHGLGHPEMH